MAGLQACREINSRESQHLLNPTAPPQGSLRPSLVQAGASSRSPEQLWGSAPTSSSHCAQEQLCPRSEHLSVQL